MEVDLPRAISICRGEEQHGARRCNAALHAHDGLVQVAVLRQRLGAQGARLEVLDEGSVAGEMREEEG